MVTELHAGSEILAADYQPSAHDTDGTDIENITTETFTDGTPGVDVTFEPGTTGKALLIVGGLTRAADRTHMGCQIREDNVSGIVVEEVQVTEHGFGGARSNRNYNGGSRGTIYDGLARGQTYFARHMYRKPPAESGTTGDISYRDLALVPLPFHGDTPVVGAPVVPVDTAVAGDPDGLAVPAAVWSNAVDSQLNLSTTDYQTGDPQVGVAFIAPPSGKVLLLIGGGGRDNDATSPSQRVFISPRIYPGTDSSMHPFAVFLEASVTFNGWGSIGGHAAYQYGTRVSIVEGLTAGAAYFAEARHTAVDWTSGNDTADVAVRDIGVIPLPDAAVGDADDTSQLNISSASYAAGSVEVGVGFTAPPSGKVLLFIGGGGRDNTNDDRVFMSPQLFLGTSAAGTEVFSAATAEDQRAFITAGEAADYQYGTRVSIVDSLTEDAAYYVRHMHRAVASDNTTNNASADAGVRDIGVVPIA